MKLLLSLILLIVSNSTIAGIINDATDARLSGATIFNIETNFGCYTSIPASYSGVGFTIESTSLFEYCAWTNYGTNGLGNNAHTPFIITFDNMVSAFGFELGAVHNSTFEIAMFDIYGGLIESLSIVNPNTGPNFFGGYGGNIKSIEISVDYSVLDGLRFVNVDSNSVPEPGSLLLFAIAIVGLAGRRFKKT